MFNFAHDRKPDDRLPHLPMRRLPARGQWHAAITCTEMIEMWTHFLGRRTLPCMKSDCPGCFHRMPRRYEAYLSLFITKPQPQHFIGVLPRNAADDLLASCENKHDLRGTIISAQRMGNRANGMVTCRIEKDTALVTKLPDTPELLAHLMKIWGISGSVFGQDHPYYTARLEAGEFSGPEHGS